MKNRPLSRLVNLLALCLVLLSSVPSADAELICGGTELRSYGGGTGSSCFQAENNMFGNTYTPQYCSWLGTCNEELVFTQPCFFNGSQFEVQGYLRYSCVVCSHPLDPECAI